MKTVNGFVLNEIIRRLIYDPKSGLKGLLIFSLGKFGLIALSRKARKIGLILGLFLIYNSLSASIKNDMAQGTEKRSNNELIAIGGDEIFTRDSAIHPNTSNAYRVPFILRNNLIWVEAVVNGKKGLLMVDTGMDQLILNQNHFKGGFTDGYVSGVIDDMANSLRKFVTLQISNLPVHKLCAFIVDLDHLEQHLKLEILGICGIGFLQQFQWVIHYHQRFIDFHPLDKSGNLLDKTLLPEPGETLQLQKDAGLLLIKVQIDGLPMNLALDTGTSSTIFDEKYKDRLL